MDTNGRGRGLWTLIDRNFRHNKILIKSGDIPMQSPIEQIKPDLENNLSDLTMDLTPENSLQSIQRDPYWPKWDSPWWKMVLFMEMGEVSRVPHETARLMLQKINSQNLHIFPLVEEELPEGCDPYRDIICHCALGTIMKLFIKMGFDINKEWDWVLPWFEKYQLPDGGFNCDEAVYTKEAPRSSFLSTLPMLEALLEYGALGKGNLTPIQMDILNKGADYLIKRKLFRSLSKDMAVISQSWLEPVFPRFYDYDILRGLSFLTDWAVQTNSGLPRESIEEAVDILSKRCGSDGIFTPGFRDFTAEGTREPRDDGKWEFVKKADLFPLLETVSSKEISSYFLTMEWNRNKSKIEKLKESGLL